MKKTSWMALLLIPFLSGFAFVPAPENNANETAPVQSRQYQFKNYMDIAIEISGKADESFSLKMRYLYNNEMQLFASKYLSMEGMENDMNMSVISDLKNQKMIMVMEDQNQAMIMPMGGTGMPGMKQDKRDQPKRYEPYEPGEDVSLEKTGNTREILGYTCDEYIYEDDENDMQMWISKGLQLTTRKEVASRSVLSLFHQYNMQEEGTLLAMKATSKKDNSVMAMEVTDVGLGNEQTIDLAGYNVMDMSSIGMPRN